MLKSKQVTTQTQIQKLTPQQIQLIKMIELPVTDLENMIQEEMTNNPTLELGADPQENSSDDNSQEDINEDYSESEDSSGNSPNDDDDDYDINKSQEEISLGDYRNEDDIPDYKLQEANNAKDERLPEFNYAAGSSLQENLNEQLGERELTAEEAACCEYIIGNLDNNGYLTRPVQAIADDIAFATGKDYPIEMLNDCLSTVQELDPAGIGARDLRECLMLQIERRKATPASTLAYSILKDYFEDFSGRHYENIIKALSISEAQIKSAIQEILSLNPKPGTSYNDTFEEKSAQIIPDFIISNIDGKIVVSLNNSNIPELHVNNSYSDMMQDWNNKANQTADRRNAVTFIKQKLDSARWFIDAIRQRNNTLMRTMQSIVDLQREFFTTGEENRLRPMILKDVAELAGVDISTVSRVSKSKYALTDFGMFNLKEFFSEGTTNDEGEEITTRAIKNILAEVIGAEDKKKPLTDDRLSEILAQKGYTVARRTVAKYREQLGIQVARLRKEI